MVKKNTVYYVATSYPIEKSSGISLSQTKELALKDAKTSILEEGEEQIYVYEVTVRKIGTMKIEAKFVEE